MSIELIRVNFSETAFRWTPHALGAVDFIGVLWIAGRRSVAAAVMACAGTIWAVTMAAYVLLLPNYARLQPLQDLVRRLPIDSKIDISPGAAEWTNDLALHTSGPAPSPSIASHLFEVASILQRNAAAVVLINEGDRRELERRGAQLRVLAQADAYTGNRLTLKSLLHPASGPLYFMAAADSTGSSDVAATASPSGPAHD